MSNGLNELMKEAKEKEALAELEKEKLEKEKVETKEEVVIPELTPEQEEAILIKRFGVGSDQLIKKEVQVVVQSEEEKEELRKKKEQDVLAAGLENKWFTKEDYDKYQQLVSDDKINIAKKKFLEENAGVEDAEDIFNELFATNEDDDFVITLGDDTEGTAPNEKKKIAKSFLLKMADEVLEKDYSQIINATKKYEQMQEAKKLLNKNTESVTSVLATFPESLEYKVGDQVYKVPVSQEDKDFVKEYFLADKDLLQSEEIKSEDLTHSAVAAIQSRNFENILKKVSDLRVAQAIHDVERGNKGIPLRTNDGIIKEEDVSEGRQVVNAMKNL